MASDPKKAVYSLSSETPREPLSLDFGLLMKNKGFSDKSRCLIVNNHCMLRQKTIFAVL